jgi:hypothetical protein
LRNFAPVKDLSKGFSCPNDMSGEPSSGSKVDITLLPAALTRRTHAVCISCTAFDVSLAFCLRIEFIRCKETG